MFHVKQFETEPAAAEQVFGAGIDLARRYTELLARDSDTLGLLGPRELPRIWSRHVLNSALIAPLLPASARVADIGSGAGLPGIPLAIARPDCQFTLIEPMERRSSWLTATVAELKLDNVTVVRSRAEEVAGGNFDVVTARAVAALKKLVRLIRPLLAGPGAELLLIKGGQAAAEIDEASPELKKRGFTEARIQVLGADLKVDTVTVVTARLS
jgi:16S rRNA (guanine527-N7)-methyltransferase